MLNTLLCLSLLACNRGTDEELIDADEPVAHLQVNQAKPGELVRVVNLPQDQAGLISALSDPDSAQEALEELVGRGAEAVPALRDTAMFGKDTSARGWAIQGLARIDDDSAGEALVNIEQQGNAPMLIRTWAAAARVQRTTSLDEVLALAPLAQQYPGLDRPIRLKVEAFSSELTDVPSALRAVTLDPNLAQVLAPIILNQGLDPLIQVMFTEPDFNVRRMAAGYVGTWAGQDKDKARQIARAYAYTPGAEKVLWDGGALYVPSLAWQKKEAQALSGHLVSWHLFCDRTGLISEKQQIFNNLQSINLHQAAGWPGWPSTDTNELLVQYGQAVGKPALEKVLAEHGVLDEDKYQRLLTQVK